MGSFMQLEFLFLAIMSFFAGAMTLFTGFGLSTLLLPVFSIFIPLPIAITATAIVHLINNFYKLILYFRNINFQIFIKFGINAAMATILGAVLLSYISLTEPNLNRIIGGIIILFALIEFTSFKNLKIDSKYLPIGGLISGFFGGLSGHQGMFRSIFLVKSDLNPKSFIATGVSIAVLVDVVRLTVYGSTFIDFSISKIQPFIFQIIISTASAIFGVFLASDFVKQMNIKIISYLISLFMVVVGVLLIFQVI
ncbi:MAG: hypothetical protein RLZZ37_1210 [Actinomycetota bacterium]